MSTQVKHRRGTTSEVNGFTPAIAELIMDVETNELVLGDGATQGGHRLPKKGSSIQSFTTLNAVVTDKTIKVGFVVNIEERTSGNGGESTWDVVTGLTANGYDVVDCTGVSGLQLQYRADKPVIDVRSLGVVSGVDNQAVIQAAQKLSESLKKPLDFSGITDISFNGYIDFQSYLHWKGADKLINTVRPLQLSRVTIGAENWIQKRDNTVATTFFKMENLGFDGSYTSGGNPPLDNLISMIRHQPDGCTDSDITYLNCHFKDVPHECTVHSPVVTGGVASGGKIDNVKMLFCSGDVTSLAGASRSCNMFKTIHGSIDDPGEYLNYPITNVTSFGNTCRGMRTLADFKRGTRHFYHDNSTVIDMTDVASISVDGVKDGVIGARNTGYQTAAAVDTKNFYEIQGIDVEVMGGGWNADNDVDAVAAVLVTDYIYPAETTGSYTGNQSVNVNVRGFNAENITGHAVRFINTRDCHVEGVLATNCDLDGVSFEYIAGKFDKSGTEISPARNSVDRIRTNGCRYTASSNSPLNLVKMGTELYNENEQYDVEFPANGKFFDGSLNLNQNPLFVDPTGGVNPSYWTGAAIYASGAAIENSPVSFSLEDASAAALHYKTYAAEVPMAQNDILYFDLLCRRDTAPSNCILVQEYDAADGFLASNFLPLVVGTSWERRQKKFTATNANCAYVKISLVPAGQSAADAANVGISHFADVYFGKRPR